MGILKLFLLFGQNYYRNNLVLVAPTPECLKLPSFIRQLSHDRLHILDATENVGDFLYYCKTKESITKMLILASDEAIALGWVGADGKWRRRS